MMNPVEQSPPDEAGSTTSRLEARARQLAGSHILANQPVHKLVLLERLREQEQLLRDAYQVFGEKVEKDSALSYTAEWLLDNFYLVQQTVRQVREDLPEGYYRQLPVLGATPHEGYPRIYALASEIILYSQAHLEFDRIRRFVQVYQEVTPLAMGELWALPTMLRLGILECLAEDISRVIGPRTVAGEAPTAKGMSYYGELADESIVGSSIQSLRTLAGEDWKQFFESVSLVEQALACDPAGLYARMDFETRDRYRKVVERFARTTGKDEIEVAREAIRLARQTSNAGVEVSAGDDCTPRPAEGQSPAQEPCWRGLKLPRNHHVGFYLVDAGYAQLASHLGYQAPARTRLRDRVFDHPTLVYLGGITLLTVAGLSGMVAYASTAGGTPGQLIAVALLLLMPAAAVAVNLVNWLVTRMLHPRTLPKLDFEIGIPDECRTMVVIPALLATVGDVRSLLQQLELHYLRNSDHNLYFALLTDFADAPEKHMPEDESLIEAASAEVQALNARYSSEAGCRFYLFHRERIWNASEDTWMGWDRKRGKLEEFNRLLGGDEGTSYKLKLGDLAVLPAIRYVITLDADTVLPRGDARRLVAALAHPLNRAEFDPRSGELLAGYTILQPRTQIKPTSANQSLFSQTFAGDTGLDLYTLAVSDVYQDLFGEGIYVGKGIYEVSAFERSLSGRVPENALLSHDLFEGLHGRAGLVTDIVLYEDYPPNYLIQMHRSHRWVRGDWQLLPWLLPRVPHAGEGTIPNALSVIDRWKIVDNLRRSLLAPALLALLICGWLWLPGLPLIWTLAGLLAPAIPLITDLVGRLVAATSVAFRRIRRLKPSLRTLVRPVRDHVLRWLLALAFLPYETLLVLDAIAVTLLRLVITRRNLLQWTTAADTVQLFGRNITPQVTRSKMVSSLILVLALVLLIVLIHPVAFAVATPLLAAWLLSPEIAYWTSRPARRRPDRLSASQRQQLLSLARRTWLFFEQFVGPEDNWLPPDHFQEAPRGAAAHRTSPTNIGLYLLSTLAAYDLGYLGFLDLSLRLRDALETMEKLERFRGHFLNWYDTSSLEPLSPRYVSTVDSGNLAACLLVLGQACRELPDASVLSWQRWQGFLDTLGLLAELVDGLGGQPAVEPLKAHLAQLRQEVLAAYGSAEKWASLLLDLNQKGRAELDRLLVALVDSGVPGMEVETLRSLRDYSGRVHDHLNHMQRDVDLLFPWLPALRQPPSLFARADLDPALASQWQRLVEILPASLHLNQVAQTCEKGQTQLALLRECLAYQTAPLAESEVSDFGRRQESSDSLNRPAAEIQEALDWCSRLGPGLESARMTVRALLIGYEDLSQRAEGFFLAMDFGFLFNSQRQVFHIGYNWSAGALDRNYYDLLASESRIASLVAIAKADVPHSHWLHLGRPLAQVDGAEALLSWSGTMFEYLLPSLLMRGYEGTLMQQSCRLSVERQIAYGSEKGVPWGISESGYYAFDANLSYQYRAFGVPGLGFKRGLGDELVITPHASLLALPQRPLAVLQNIARLSELNLLGRYGFYEAVDFTHSRLSLGQKHATVYSYMAHHQAMILLSLANYLKNDVMVRRFHSDPRVQSVELLLQEQVPALAPIENPVQSETHAVRPNQTRMTLTPWSVPVEAPMPQAHYLSNGRYGVLITSAGGGYSRWKDIALTRWRADTTLDDWGTWIYVQDRENGLLWSAGHQPTGVQADSQEVLFYPHKAEFRRRDHDITLQMEITVAPQDDLEVRRLTLANQSDRPRRLTLTSYGEIVLAPQAADLQHPAFHKLFVESEYLPELNGLLFRRRPRSAEEKPLYLVHLLVVDREQKVTGAYESDRARFLGRGGTPRAPVVLTSDGRRQTADGGRRSAVGGHALSGAVGATLDPIMALRQDFDLEAHESVRLAFITLAAGSREEALALANRSRTWPAIQRVFQQARTQSEKELRQLGLASPELERFQQLLSLIQYPHPALRAEPATLAANTRGQSSLWAYSISGDFPVLLVRVGDAEEMLLVQRLLQAHAYWRERNIMVDLVILNMKETGYSQEVLDQIHRAIAAAGADAWLNRRGGIFVLRADQMGEADRVLLESAARVVLDGSRGSLAGQLAELRSQPAPLPAFTPGPSGADGEEPTSPLARPTGLLFDNGLGGFSPDGREYVIYLEPGQWTPAPWVNVIATPQAGFLVSESGSGYTWAANSGENRLTPWRNDPVSDRPGEAIYLRDEETAELWSPTPLPIEVKAPYLIRHGAGYSIFEHHGHGLKHRLRLFLVPDAAVKVARLRLENTWKRARRITVTYYAEWVLGTTRDATQQYILPEYDPQHFALLARNPNNVEFAERVAFLTADREPHGLTTDRSEFLGRMGSLSRPAALERVGLASRVQPGLDPCAAIQLHVDLAPGEAEEVTFLIGQGADREEALKVIEQYREAASLTAAWEATTEFWDDLLGTVQVETPDLAMNLLLNRWLLYQALACRLWGRSGFYQSSGGFGFRDQLQDVMALVDAAPSLVREHILRAATRQFEAGDVLHWWHPPSGRGVRTRISDDLLWLPYVTAHYVSATGDGAILTEKAPFLKGMPLEAREEERYGQYEATLQSHTLYIHCCRALERGMTAGPHGLPLIGGGDWNDGMNRVGIQGRGESVWLGWFLYDVLTRFAPIAEWMGDDQQAAAYRQKARDLQQALEASAWDENWYLRAYYDDGSPLGSIRNRECQIDSIAQSWAVLSGAADPKRAASAMQAVENRLLRHDHRLVLLLAPPFDQTPRDPGYIKGYLPGIRENGGQYTHAALWAIWAFVELGQGDRAWDLFQLINPIYHADTPEKSALYKVEPYVVAADVYGVAPHTGRGGWTWYTGSSGWMYRLGLEAILGLRRAGTRLHINPCIPRNWPGYKVSYRFGRTHYTIQVENPQAVNRGVKQVTLDGQVVASQTPGTSEEPGVRRLPLSGEVGDFGLQFRSRYQAHPGAWIPLLDDGQPHTVLVHLG